MSSASLTLTDSEAGLDMVVEYVGGFNPLSPAHDHIKALIDKLAELAAPQGEAVHLTVNQMEAMKANPLLTTKGAVDLVRG